MHCVCHYSIAYPLVTVLLCSPRFGFKEQRRDVQQVLSVAPRTPPDVAGVNFATIAERPDLLERAYVVAQQGYEDMPIEELQRFRQLGSRTAGHPEHGHTLGIETTTGPLGQGISTAVGMALAERMLAARHGTDLVDHFTYVIAGDGCLQEGISHEAIDLAGHLKLSRLVVFWDDNAISIDGPTSCGSGAHEADFHLS